MSSIKNNPNMTANVAATKIQSAWRSGRALLASGYDYDYDYDDEYEPVYDEKRRFLGYIDREEMKNLCDPAYAAWVLDEEEGVRDPLIDRVASERLGRKYPSTRPSISQKARKYFNEEFRYTEDGACAYCGFGPKNPLPSWPKNWRCSVTHSNDDPKLAKYPELWAKIKKQSDYLM